jgi:hypothetical protein
VPRAHFVGIDVPTGLEPRRKVLAMFIRAGTVIFILAVVIVFLIVR